MDNLKGRIADRFADLFEWDKIAYRINPVIDLIHANKLKADKSQQFWAMYDRVLVDEFNTTSHIKSLIELGSFCEGLLIGFLPIETNTIGFIAEPNTPYGRESIIIDESSRIKRMLEDIYKDNSNLLKLDFREFEEVIAELLLRQGFKVELTKRTKDGGHDIIAMLNLQHHNPMRFLVECKRYTEKKVGIDLIRSFLHVVGDTKSNRGILVTTSYFTKEAHDERMKYANLLDYKDKDQVIEWVKAYFNGGLTLF